MFRVFGFVIFMYDLNNNSHLQFRYTNTIFIVLTMFLQSIFGFCFIIVCFIGQNSL